MIKPGDKKFIAELRKNSRETLTNISRKIKIPISTLYDKLKNQEKNLIIKHTTLLDFNKLGYNCRANIMIKVKRENRERIGSFLKEHDNVNNLYKINNGYDYLIEAIFQHIKEMEEFMEQTDQEYGIEEKKTFYIIEDLKREEFMTT